jgi:hypothetical protein
MTENTEKEEDSGIIVVETSEEDQDLKDHLDPSSWFTLDIGGEG